MSAVGDVRIPLGDLDRMLLELIIRFIPVENLGPLMLSSWTVMRMVIKLHPKLLIAIFSPGVADSMVGRDVHNLIRQAFGEKIQPKSAIRPKRFIRVRPNASVMEWNAVTEIVGKDVLKPIIEEMFGEGCYIGEEATDCRGYGNSGVLKIKWWTFSPNGALFNERNIPWDIILRISYPPSESWLLTLFQVNGTVDKSQLTELMRDVANRPRCYYKDVMTGLTLLRPEGMAKKRNNSPIYVCRLSRALLTSFISK
jgi:hypothetical protein